MAIQTYDPKLVVATFLGIPILGYADGTFINAERNEDSFSVTVGAGGEAARVRSRNKSGQVTITLMQTSPSNDALSAANKLDELTGEGVGPLLVKDLKGSTLLLAENAWIKKPASVEFAKDLSNREWVIECGALELLVGGAF